MSCSWHIKRKHRKHFLSSAKLQLEKCFPKRNHLDSECLDFRLFINYHWSNKSIDRSELYLAMTYREKTQSNTTCIIDNYAHQNGHHVVTKFIKYGLHYWLLSSFNTTRTLLLPSEATIQGYDHATKFDHIALWSKWTILKKSKITSNLRFSTVILDLDCILIRDLGSLVVPKAN